MLQNLQNSMYPADSDQHVLQVLLFKSSVVVVVLGFYVPPTAKVIRRWDLSFKSHLKDIDQELWVERECCDSTVKILQNWTPKNEPCHEKSCMPGFLPGPTQTGLYIH